MKTVSVLAGLALFSTITFGADQSAVKVSPKLSAMLSAKDEKGKEIITPEQRDYFESLNDNLRAMLSAAVEKETISHAEHLSILLSLQLLYNPVTLNRHRRQMRHLGYDILLLWGRPAGFT